MNSTDFQGWTCTCTHGGGGHMPACDMFVPTREQYAEACRERDQAREVVKAAVRFFDAYDLAGGLAATGAQAEALNDAIDAISVPSGTAGGIVRPWWVNHVDGVREEPATAAPDPWRDNREVTR